MNGGGGTRKSNAKLVSVTGNAKQKKTRRTVNKYQVRNDVFSECKERLNILEVVRVYYAEPNKAGFICCPFHSEKTPSCKVDGQRQRWHCFGCGAGGSVVDFTAKLFNLEPFQAVKKLNDDFHLGLSVEGGTATDEQRAEIARRQRLQAVKATFEAWQGETINWLIKCVRAANTALKRTDNNFTDGEAAAVYHLAELEWMLDVLEHGELSEQMKLFRRRGDIDKICSRILGARDERKGLKIS